MSTGATGDTDNHEVSKDPPAPAISKRASRKACARREAMRVKKQSPQQQSATPPPHTAVPAAANAVATQLMQAFFQPASADEVQKAMLHANRVQPDKQRSANYVVLTRAEREYLETIGPAERADLIGSLQVSVAAGIPLRFRVAQSCLPQRLKSEIVTRLMSSEGCNGKYEAYVEKVLQLPLNKFSPPLEIGSSIDGFIRSARDLMDRAIYGQYGMKDEIVRLLCQFAVSGATKPFALALQGAPGIGKTSFVQNALAPALKRPFSFFSLGGASDGSALVGHNYTYEGSQCGSIANALISHKCMDGIYFFDELDKISDSGRGQEVANVLMHLTDRAQNGHFNGDKYFAGVEMDLSRAIFVTSFNEEAKVSPILLDRMQIVRFEEPSLEEKREIAKRHLLPRAMEAAGLPPCSVVFSNEVLDELISKRSFEKGVRGLEKDISRIVGTLNVLANDSGKHLRAIHDDLPDRISLPVNVTCRLAFGCLDELPIMNRPPPSMYT